jgi:lipid-A-disaccharide synthase
MKYYIIAGEASGDLHGSNLIHHLKMQDGRAEVRAWGGDKMEAEGAIIVKHYRDLAFMGFAEVVMNLPTILRNIKFCKKDILNFNPDVLILVDYPGFNLRIAEFAHEHGIRVFYYISPQIWAWKQNRVYKIKRFVERMFVILPFEKDFYKRFDVDVSFVGHPLLDAISSYNSGKSEIDNTIKSKPIIALLPGSRKQEISTMLPIMLQSLKGLKHCRCIVAMAPSIPKEFYLGITKANEVELIANDTYNILNKSDAALVTSGTATLETALFKVPQIVCYKGSAISFWLAKKLVKVKYISLVNLILDNAAVPELIQGEMNAENINTHLLSIVNPGIIRNEMLGHYDDLERKLGGPGASERAAKEMVERLNKSI